MALTLVQRDGDARAWFAFTGQLVGVDRRQARIEGGSLWLPVAAFVQGASPQLMAGMPISTATLGSSDAMLLDHDRLRLRAGARGGLQLHPALPETPGAELPSMATLTLGDTGTALRADADAAIRVFGVRHGLTAGHGVPRFDPRFDALVLPMGVDGELQAGEGETEDRFTGRAPLLRGLWLWHTRHPAIAPGESPESDGSSLVVEAGAGLAWRSPLLMQTPTRLVDAAVQVGRDAEGPLERCVATAMGPREGAAPRSFRLRLWSGAELQLCPFAGGGPLLVEQRQARRSIALPGRVEGQLPLPRCADGGTLELSAPDARLTLIRDGAGGTQLRARWRRETPFQRVSIAAENALLLTDGARAVELSGEVRAGPVVEAGTATIDCGLVHLLPILPDPYAANFEADGARRHDAPLSTLSIRLAWDGGGASVSLHLPDLGHEGAPALTPEPLRADRESLQDRRAPLWEAFAQHLGAPVADPALRLLDMSGAADQWGVALGTGRRGRVPWQMDGLTLQLPGTALQVFAQPQVAWEPFSNLPNPRAPYPGDPADGSPVPHHPADDGEAALLGVATARLIPVQPRRAVQALVAAGRDEDAAAAAIFSLPFGIVAAAAWGRTQPLQWLMPPGASLLQARFGSWLTVSQLRIEAGVRLRPGVGPVDAAGRSLLPGAAMSIAHYDRIGNAGGRYDALGSPTREFFNSRFGTSHAQWSEVPLRRIDLSGHGASTFSTWRDDEAQPPTVTEVRFDVANGRASRQVVHLVSILWPCQAVVVRTVTFDRLASGALHRRDSGWLATTAGRYARDGSGIDFHPGLVRGLFDIRAIRDDGPEIRLAGGQFPMQPVRFDCDVEMDGAPGRLPSQGQRGYVQFIPVPQPGGGAQAPARLTPAALAELFRRVGPLGGPVDGMLDIARSGQPLRASAIRADVVRGDAAFAVAVHGMPSWPAGSPWSVVRVHRQPLADRTEPVDPALGVPVVRANGADALMADCADLLAGDHPAADYALLYAGGTHRALFARLRFPAGERRIRGATTPLVADPYAFVDAAGLFPRLDAALRTAAADFALAVGPQGPAMLAPLQILEPAAARALADTPLWSLSADYARDMLVNRWRGRNTPSGAMSEGMFLFIDPARRPVLEDPSTWPVRMPAVATVLKVPGLGGELLRIVTDLPGRAGLAPEMPSPEVIVGPVLRPLQDLMSVLDGLQLPAGLQLSFTGSGLDGAGYRLRFTGRMRLATRDGDRIDVGLGKLRGELALGADFSLGLGTPARGTLWLEIGGDLQQGILPPLLYAGGLMKFRIAIDEHGDLRWELDAGTTGSVGGTLIPGLVALEATVHYAYRLKPSLEPTVRLGMDARAKLLEGLVGVKFGVDAAVGIGRPGPDIDTVRIAGDVTAMGELTAAWVFKEDFSRTFRFQQDVQLRYVALAAMKGLLPLPV